MEDHSRDNKRIAKNTLIIYVNLFLNVLIGLYSSRLVLQALGVSDYGLYNVVGGIAVLFVFISDALSSTTYRFVNVEMGKPDGDVNRIFNVCRTLHIVLAVILFALVEAGGIWYINHYLNIEPGKESDALFVFQTATLVLCLGIMNVPYSSLLCALEKFFFSSLVNIVGKLIEFGLVIWLLRYDGNRIRAYALIMILSTVIPFIVYHLSCYRRWPEYVKWRIVKGWQNYKATLMFSNYNLLGGLAGMSRSQGAALLINYFFGTTVNGAFAVAKNVERHVSSFSSRFQEAAGPQVTQNYSSGDHDRVYFLISRTGKYSMLMLLLAFFPLWAEMEFVLDVWLDEVPEGALVFCRLVLLELFVSATDGGLWQVVNASGKVAIFRVGNSILTVSCIPIGYFILKSGAPPYVLLFLFIGADTIWRIIQLWLVHRILHFPTLRFCRDVYRPVAVVCLTIIPILFLTSRIPWDSTLWHLGRFLLVLLLTTIAALYLGLKNGERQKIVNQLLHRK